MLQIRSGLAALAVAVLLLAGCGGHSPTHHAVTPAPSAMGSVHPPGWGAPVAGPRGLVAPGLRALPTAEQFDTVTLFTIPHGAPYLAGYTSGHWPTYLPLTRLSWHPHVISIAVNASHHAQCLDIEPGDASPSQAASWYFAVKNDPGMRGVLIDGKPCEYSSLWEYLNQVRPVLQHAGISSSQIWEWDADYTGRAHLDNGFNCTQWTSKARGLNLDESTCTLAFLGANPTQPLCYHHRIPVAQCAAAKAQVASYRRAVAASQGAYRARSCEVFAQRIGLFGNLTRQFPHDRQAPSWRRALGASQKVYNVRACNVFASRVGLFQNLAAQTEGAN